MTIIARDPARARDFVYVWPEPILGAREIACRDTECAVMCPAWLVGDRLGTGNHRWINPDPMQRPATAYFVTTAPVSVGFDMVTSVLLPGSGHTCRLRAAGSLEVRCADPGMLVAQFVGLPFDHLSEGVLRSVSRSVERMIARLLTRRIMATGSATAVTYPGVMPGIVEELVSYRPTAGSVFGMELVQITQLAIGADDGTTPAVRLAAPWTAAGAPSITGARRPRSRDIPLLETARGIAVVPEPVSRHETQPGIVETAPAARSIEAPVSGDEITEPGVAIPVPPPGPPPARPSVQVGPPRPATVIPARASAGEVLDGSRVAPGTRVILRGDNGTRIGTVRRLVSGYCELDLADSGESWWVPRHAVVPE